MFIGHKKQKELMKRIISSGKVPHAFLFEGLSCLGKKTLAIELFKFANCKKNEPCGKCRECSLIEKGNHPDLVLMAPEKNEIRIGQIRDLIYKASLSPYSSFFKWIIIDKADLMNKEAANSLLKLLEEPSGNAVFFLISEYPESILSTVRSRTQRIKFFPLKEDEIENALKSRGCGDEVAREITLFSFGRPGIALDFFSNQEKLELRKKKVKKMAEVISRKTPLHLRFKYAKNASEDPEKLEETLKIWLSYLRMLFLEKSKNGKVGYSYGKLKDSMDAVQKTIYLISKANVNPRIAMEALLMDL